MSEEEAKAGTADAGTAENQEKKKKTVRTLDERLAAARADLERKKRAVEERQQAFEKQQGVVKKLEREVEERDKREHAKALEQANSELGKALNIDLAKMTPEMLEEVKRLLAPMAAAIGSEAAAAEAGDGGDAGTGDGADEAEVEAGDGSVASGWDSAQNTLSGWNS